MARKRTHRRTHRTHHRKSHHVTRRRHRMGAAPEGLKEVATAIVGTIVGYAAGNLLVSQGQKLLNTATSTIPGVIEVGVGGVMAVKVKNKFLKYVGVALAANGVFDALGSNGLKVLPAAIGYGPDPMHRPARLAMGGYRDVPKVGAFPKPNAIGFPKPNAIGYNPEQARLARMYAGVYGC